MLVGDGPKRTIITSSRSVKTGYTTYSSATAGKKSLSLSLSLSYLFEQYYILIIIMQSHTVRDGGEMRVALPL